MTTGGVAGDAVLFERQIEDGGAMHARVRDVLADLLRTSWLFRIGLIIVVIDVFLTCFGPMLAPQSLSTVSATANLPPSAAHWFGTDGTGLDVFSRAIAAPRVDFEIAFSVTAVALAAGTLLGVMAGLSTGWAGELATRTSDMVQALPGFVVALLVIIGANQSTAAIVIVIAFLNVPFFLRLARSEVVTLRSQPFVEAAAANGNSRLGIAFRQVLPNALTPVLAQASVTLALSLLAITGLSFLGAGVRPPAAEWGNMISAGSNGIVLGYWWISVFPGLAIAVSVFGFAAVAEGLQRALRRQS